MKSAFLTLGVLAALAVGGVGVAAAEESADGGDTCDGPPCCERCE